MVRARTITQAYKVPTQDFVTEFMKSPGARRREPILRLVETMEEVPAPKLEDISGMGWAMLDVAERNNLKGNLS